MTRPDGRTSDQLRPVLFTRAWLDHAEGSVLAEFGRTRVLCAASVQEEVPRWRRGRGVGWVIAETDMNVVCTGDGRFVEIQGTAESGAFDRALLDRMLDLTVAGCAELTKLQQAALAQVT